MSIAELTAPREFNFTNCVTISRYAVDFLLKSPNQWDWFALLIGEFSGGIIHISPIRNIFYIPSKICGYGTWKSPVVGIVSFSLISMEMYALSSSFFLKGAVISFHALAMKVFAYYPNRPISDTGSSLNSVCHRIFLNNGPRSTHLVIKRADQYTGFIFMISMIATTILSQNLIVAQTLSYTLAGLVKPIAIRLLRNYPSLVVSEG